MWGKRSSSVRKEVRKGICVWFDWRLGPEESQIHVIVYRDAEEGKGRPRTRGSSSDDGRVSYDTIYTIWEIYDMRNMSGETQGNVECDQCDTLTWQVWSGVKGLECNRQRAAESSLVFCCVPRRARVRRKAKNACFLFLLFFLLARRVYSKPHQIVCILPCSVRNVHSLQ